MTLFIDLSIAFSHSLYFSFSLFHFRISILFFQKHGMPRIITSCSHFKGSYVFSSSDCHSGISFEHVQCTASKFLYSLTQTNGFAPVVFGYICVRCSGMWTCTLDWISLLIIINYIAWVFGAPQHHWWQREKNMYVNNFFKCAGKIHIRIITFGWTFSNKCKIKWYFLNMFQFVYIECADHRQHNTA